MRAGLIYKPSIDTLKLSNPGPPPTCPFIHNHNVKERRILSERHTNSDGQKTIPAIATGVGCPSMLATKRYAALQPRSVEWPLSRRTSRVNSFLYFCCVFLNVPTEMPQKQGDCLAVAAQAQAFANHIMLGSAHDRTECTLFTRRIAAIGCRAR